MNPGCTEAVRVESLSHTYPSRKKTEPPRQALRNISFSVREGEIFCVLGPNGSGKSTLFRILSTALEPTSGIVLSLGMDIRKETRTFRRNIGVLFQHPSLDVKLTPRENLLLHGHLYGLHGPALGSAIDEMLSKAGVLDRADDTVEKLSGGSQRRVELAKTLLHRPRLLILDEPSTGLDPAARKDFTKTLRELQSSEGVTVLLTTHILDEAERCDRIAIVERGSLVALGTPEELRQEIGGDVIAVASPDPERLCAAILQKFGGSPAVVDGTVRIEREGGHEFIPQLVESFPGEIDSVTLAKPTLEDVFIHKTGHKFWGGLQ